MGKRICSLKDCGKPHYGHGLCGLHYRRWKRAVDRASHLDDSLIMRERDLPRFWKMVAPADQNGCWKWTGSRNGEYGQFGINGLPRRVHRVSYSTFVGVIREGMHIDHVYDRGCRSKLCVNPAHLEAVTPKVNIRRARAVTDTHCREGHPFDRNNTYLTPGGTKVCKTCRRNRQRERKAEQP